MNAVPESRVEFLPMSLQDIDEVLAIEYRVCPFPWGRGNFTDSLASGYHCWVARQNGEMVGYFVVMSAVDEAHLLTISVAASKQKQGYGARLLQQVMQIARANGARILLLEVRPSNTSALSLYRHFGFQQIGVRKAYYPAVGGREDALVLTRALDEVLA